MTGYSLRIDRTPLGWIVTMESPDKGGKPESLDLRTPEAVAALTQRWCELMGRPPIVRPNLDA